jgi:hypothetical protein
MPDWLVATMLVVFAMHFAAFARLAITRRERYYIAVSTTFALLMLAFGLRLAAPDLAVAGTPLHWIARWLAWASAALSISWLLARKFYRPSRRRN